MLASRDWFVVVKQGISVLLTVSDLKLRVGTALTELIDELVDWTGRGGAEERDAWRNSLPALAEALQDAQLSGVHVHFEQRERHVALEYKLPGTSACCDVVLLGRNSARPSAVVVELKDWRTEGDGAGIAEGLIGHAGQQMLHPSDQLRGYVHYCEHFHSAVVGGRAEISGCVLMTRGTQLRPYRLAPNERLSEAFPLFSTSRADVDGGFRPFLLRKITEPDAAFATAFATGTFRQDRGFMAQIGRQIMESEVRHLELLDNQRHAFNLCHAHVCAAIDASTSGRHVILVEGPPGSGKSAVAAKLWATLVLDEMVSDGNISLVTTSQSQSSTWTTIVDRIASSRVGRGVVRKATSFTPIDIAMLSKIRKKTGDSDLYKSAKSWRTNMAHLRASDQPFRAGAEDESALLLLVDEAHALINPEAEHGVGQYGFVTGLGPQAWHLIRGSKVCVFLLDPEQGFRSRENTSIADIVRWATEFGAQVERVSLHGSQFRCAGSAEYVGWVDALLEGRNASELGRIADRWYSSADGAPVDRVADASASIDARVGASKEHLAFRVFDNPFEMEDALRQRSFNQTVRLLSSYSRPWKTREEGSPHRLRYEHLDFHEVVKAPDGSVRYWSRPWNVVDGDDYTGFVLGDRAGTAMHEDALSEVGCPYAVRGFDYDFIGILWLDDLLWRGGRWVAPLDHVHESGIKTEVGRARREGPLAPAGPHGVNVLNKVQQAYRILLSRALTGVYLWIADDETREHVRQCLG